ncbi:MAG: anthraniloyl-CoA monooxygenase [Gammaproteobacteria bacterium]|jgi:anthraniloyl-CoA monooxygenase
MKISVIGGGPGGLYFAILVKKAWPDSTIDVFERNRSDDTFGFGVVFSDQTLGFLDEYDNPSYESIRRSFAYWDDVDVHYHGSVLRCAGNGFCGCSRLALLQILHERATSLGVNLHFEREVSDESEFSNSDLIVAADGLASVIRSKYEDSFGTEIVTRRNYFCWLGSTRPLDAFKYFFRATTHGIIVMHAYQYEPAKSTWVCEMQPSTWEGFKFGDMQEHEYALALEKIFAEELDGHKFIVNRSLWRQFPEVKNKTWVRDNLVLLGDAQHTAHFSIGSGTKLAMESAIALFESLKQHEDIDSALAAFDTDRRADVEITQHAADVSLAWFETMDEHWDVEPEKFAFQVMSRSKQITYENLRLRDRDFVAKVEAGFTRAQVLEGYALEPGTPPMFAPYRLRDMHLVNRVVLSPMAQYSARDGLPDKWHLVHYGSRAIGGAGLIYTEMTCPSADARITPGCTGLWNAQQKDAWQEITEFVHTQSRAKVCMQIGHAGRKGSTGIGWDGMDLPLPADNWPLVSASALPYRQQSAVPSELTRDQMAVIIGQFVQATKFAEQANFDMVELHAAHGYLLASFISPLTNWRSDEFGGAIDARMRFPVEVFRAMRAVFPKIKPMSVRLSAADWSQGGITEDDLVRACELLKDAGVDAINVSTGQTVSDDKPVYGRMFQVSFADKVKHRVKIPVIVAGNITNADQVNTILLSGRADLVALARPQLSNPYFVLEAAARYGYREQFWPKPYLSGQAQAYLIGEREAEEQRDIQIALKPPSHQIKDHE